MRRVRKPINQINVVPYIDVMLVLLIIFMVTAPLIAPGEIELPSVGSKLTVPVEPFMITLHNDKSFGLEDKATKSPEVRVSTEQLLARILERQKQGEQPVVIKADKNARYEDVIGILDLLQRNGVRKVGLLARPTT
jgi:biopolymer transport protein TolR